MRFQKILIIIGIITAFVIGIVACSVFKINFHRETVAAIDPTKESLPIEETLYRYTLRKFDVFLTNDEQALVKSIPTQEARRLREKLTSFKKQRTPIIDGGLSIQIRKKDQVDNNTTRVTYTEGISLKTLIDGEPKYSYSQEYHTILIRDGRVVEDDFINIDEPEFDATRRLPETQPTRTLRLLPGDPYRPASDREPGLIVSQSIISWLSTQQILSAFDLCVWNPYDKRPGHGTFGCDWQIAKLTDPFNGCHMRLEINSYDPDSGTNSIYPDYAANIVLIKPPEGYTSTSTSELIVYTQKNEILNKDVDLSAILLKDGYELRVYTPRPNSIPRLNTRLNKQGKKPWEAFGEAFVLHLAENYGGQELEEACQAL